jgi:X-Pro dipeptidyl-peptidase (S15 family)
MGRSTTAVGRPDRRQRISYSGAACDFLASSGHPAVRAIAPLSAVWDTYTHHYSPGGLLLNLAHIDRSRGGMMVTGGRCKLCFQRFLLLGLSLYSLMIL